MLYCVKCQKGLPDGTIFCDYCGNEIADGSSVTTAATLPDLRQGGRPRAETETRRHAQADEPSHEPASSLSSAAPPHPLPIELHPQTLNTAPPQGSNGSVPHEEKTSSARLIQLRLGRDVFELSGQSSYLVGRHDLDQQLFPDIDLHDWDGAAAGVSRRHIMIRVIGNVVSIEDLESRNSTILNGYRLFPHQQYPLVDNDEVRLGDITLLVRILSIN